MNAIINRLNKTKHEKTIEQHIEQIQQLESAERQRINEQKRKQAELDKQQKLEYAKLKNERSYDHMFTPDQMISNAELAYHNENKNDESNNTAEDFDFM